MSEAGIIQLAIVIGITLVVCTGMVATATVVDGKQKCDAVERVHQRTIEAAKTLPWKVEQKEAKAGD